MTDTLLELTADAILGARDLDLERVDMPEWGGYVYVRGLTGRERDDFEYSMIDRTPARKGRRQQSTVEVRMQNLRAGLVARCVVDSEGRRLFKDEQVAQLGEKSAAALDRLYDVASRLSGLRAEDVEELVEDFSDDPSEPSTTT